MQPRALVVEDDPMTRVLLRALLESIGCRVDEASDGEQAITRLAEADYSVVLLDIALPKVSGTQVMEHLYAIDPEKLQRIIVVTGLNVDDIRGLFPTVCHALAKPVLPGRLRESVAKCLRTSV
jgi:two-component system phosphate regulon response regulator PhoB